MSAEIKKREMIIEIGAELGSITLYRMQTDQGWCFSMDMDDWTPDLLDQEPIHKTYGPVVAWEAAVELLDRYTWPKLFPVFVHPDFKRQIWDAVQERFSKLPKISDAAQSAQQNWRLVCDQD